MLEKQIEKYLKEQVQARGWLCWKLVSPGTTGVPDRIVIGNRQIVFVELKKPETGRVSKVQQFRLHQLQGLGHRTKIIDSKAGVDNLIKGLSKGVYSCDL